MPNQLDSVPFCLSWTINVKKRANHLYGIWLCADITILGKLSYIYMHIFSGCPTFYIQPFKHQVNSIGKLYKFNGPTECVCIVNTKALFGDKNSLKPQ